MIPGEIFVKNKVIACNVGKKNIKLSVTNTGERPVQIGSHFHFFEVNKQMLFEREKTFGMRLNIASGTGLRFQPGETKEVELVELGGEQGVYGLNGLTCGLTTDSQQKESSLKRAAAAKFKGA